MAPSILHRALSFSNQPIHRRDLSLLQEDSGVSNRHEGLALLTTIAEGDGYSNPRPQLPTHSPLEKSLINKILRLRKALDLPCQSPCDALYQLILDTLEALKIAYPKCLSGYSGLSGNHISSVQQGLVHLHKILLSVQDYHAEHKKSTNLGSGKQTIIDNESLDHLGSSMGFVGEHVTDMLDQVTPMAKEMFSFMENSRNPNEVAAAEACPEDLPERRSLPPVLCRPRSPPHKQNAGDHPSDSAEVATPCQDGAARHTEESKVQEPAPRQDADEGGCTGEDGQTSKREPPSTPTGDSLLQTTPPSSVSPHPLAAPPPSPMPVAGLPMLLQSWEAMQGDNAAAATSPPPAEQPAEADANGSKDGSASAILSVPMEAGQASSTPSTYSHESPQLSVQDGNAAVPSVPPPAPVPVHKDRVHEGPSAADSKAVEAVASAPSPPPPPTSSLTRGVPVRPARVSGAPPPPPPRNMSAAKKAASKLKRSTQMGSLYRHLRDRVEGSGCTHGGQRQSGRKPRTPGGAKGDAGQGMADALAEMTKRSAYFRQIEEDAGNHAATILQLKEAIGAFQSKDMGELMRFREHVEQELACLSDETQVLARFEGFPCRKLETLRMAAALYSKLDSVVCTLKGWKLAGPGPISQQLDKVEGYFSKIKDDVDMMERNKDEEMKRFQSHSIHFDLGVLVRIKECMVDLSSNCMELALKESHDAKEASVKAGGAQATSPSRTLWRVFQLAFRVYNLAGGQDERADRLTSILAHEIEAHPL